MSNSKKLFIAFCEENSNLAKEISQKLQRVRFKFELISSEKVKGNSSLADLIMDQSNQGLLLISDNFLKSEICMQKMLNFINNENAFKNVKTVIVDGRYPAENGQGFKTVETTFDRVSNVIKYMNYWQERYLDLRKEKRSVPAAEEVEFNVKLERVKSISSGIGDFLRILQTKEHTRFQDFEKNDFELFFKKYGDDGLLQNYRTIAANDPKKEIKEAEPDLPPTSKIDLTKASKKEIVLPVLEEKVAEIDINAVENISQSLVEKELTTVTENAPSLDSIGSVSEKKKASSSKIKENQTEFTSSFEQQVEEIVEEIENEESQSNPEEFRQASLNEENIEDSSQILENIFEEEEEDITADFDPMTYTISEEQKAENKTLENPDNSEKMDVDDQIFEASNLIESGKIEEAILKLKSVLKQEPKNNGARYMYAMLLLNYQEDFEKATKQLEKVVEIDPQNCEAFEHLAKIAESNNDFPAAKEFYEKVASLKPHTFGIYYKLGLITSGFFNDKKKQAFKYFKKAIKQENNNEDAHYRLGILMNETFKKPKKALKHFKTVIKINPEHQFVNYDIALIFNGLGNLKKAAQFYKRAWQINSEIKTPENDIVFDYDENKSDQPPLSAEKKETKKEIEPGKVVFITGATSGIGKATAELFAANGFRLILTGRRKDRLDDLQKEFNKKFETKSMILPFDVRNIEDVKNAIEELDDEWSKVDILINNAGLAKGYAPIHKGNLEHWEAMIDTNIKGLLYLTRAIAPHMVKRQSGHIINICSSAGHEVYPNGNVYCATKFAVDALTKSMRLDLHKHNIRVGQVSPGHVEETEFAMVRYEDKEKAKIFKDFQPLKSKDVAEAIFFMVSAPSHVNIQDIRLMGTQQASNVFIDRSGR